MKEEQKDNLLKEVVKNIDAIKAQVVNGVIKDYETRRIVNAITGKYTGMAVILQLNTRFDYNDEVLKNWKKMLKAYEWFISVNRSQLRVTFKVRYKSCKANELKAQKGE